jgi:hypothetical protein
MFKQVHGKWAVLRARVLEGREWFSKGRDEDEFHIQPGRTSSKQDKNVERVRTLRDYCRLAIRIIAEERNTETATIDFDGKFGDEVGLFEYGAQEPLLPPASAEEEVGTNLCNEFRIMTND